MERPFFDVGVELTVPTVTMNPPLDAIAAVNSVAKKILKVSESLHMWGRALHTASSCPR